jgi:hypothetical protein
LVINSLQTAFVVDIDAQNLAIIDWYKAKA